MKERENAERRTETSKDPLADLFLHLPREEVIVDIKCPLAPVVFVILIIILSATRPPIFLGGTGF
jgi:hypothetical protein